MNTESAELYDLLYDWKDYAGEAERLHSLIAARNPKARTLLDVACGTARHLEHLAAWYQVEGLDIEEGLIEVARRKLPNVRLHVADMRDFDLGRRFDVVTCLFGSIGYVREADAMRSAIATMARHLEPSGLLIVEPWVTPDTFDPMHLGRVVTVSRPDLEAVRMNDARVEDGVSVMDFHYLVARPGRAIEHLVETHALGLFTVEQYRAAFEAAGLAADHDPEGLIGRGVWLGTLHRGG